MNNKEFAKELENRTLNLQYESLNFQLNCQTPQIPELLNLKSQKLGHL